MKLGKFHVKWQHKVQEGFTYIQVIGDDHPLPRVETLAVLSEKDMYCKEVGRVVSLTRALMSKGEEGSPAFTKSEIRGILSGYREKFARTYKNPVKEPFFGIIQAQGDKLEEYINNLKL